MAERDKGGGRDIRFRSADAVAQARDRERKLRMLRCLGEALGRQVEDFYGNATGDNVSESRAACNGRE